MPQVGRVQVFAKDTQIAIIANHRSIRAVAFEEFSGHCRDLLTGYQSTSDSSFLFDGIIA